MRNFDWGYILDGDICSCYWEEPEDPPILDCDLPEGDYQAPLFDTTVFNPWENRERNLVNEVGRFRNQYVDEGGYLTQQKQPGALNLVEGFSPPLPIWLMWDFDRYDQYWWMTYDSNQSSQCNTPR